MLCCWHSEFKQWNFGTIQKNKVDVIVLNEKEKKVILTFSEYLKNFFYI